MSFVERRERVQPASINQAMIRNHLGLMKRKCKVLSSADTAIDALALSRTFPWKRVER